MIKNCKFCYELSVTEFIRSITVGGRGNEVLRRHKRRQKYQKHKNAYSFLQYFRKIYVFFSINLSNRNRSQSTKRMHGWRTRSESCDSYTCTCISTFYIQIKGRYGYVLYVILFYMFPCLQRIKRGTWSTDFHVHVILLLLLFFLNQVVKIKCWKWMRFSCCRFSQKQAMNTHFFQIIQIVVNQSRVAYKNDVQLQIFCVVHLSNCRHVLSKSRCNLSQ